MRPGDLITHINGEPIQGLLHHQVLHLILSGGDRINIRTIPLDSTTIKSGGRRRNPSSIKMARRPYSCRRRSAQVKRDSHSDKKRRASLLRRLSSKRASAEIHQSVSGSSPVLTPSRSFQSLTRSLASADSLPASPTRTKSPRSPPTARLCSQSDSPHSTGNSSQSSSPSSSVPNSPASSTHLPHFPRPSSLHGLKHKLTQTFHSPRRKSVGHIPLSPLARTPSPSPITSTSPTRSPSPLAFPVGHHPSTSQVTQTFQTLKSSAVLPLSATICSSAKKSFMRPKSAEPSSPLLRRALSPDRLHPKSAEVKAKRESFSGQASPLALASSPSSRTQYLSHSPSSKLCLSSQRSSTPYSSGGVGKSLTDLADVSSDHYVFQEYDGNCSTPKSRLEGRISRSTVSHLRKRGEKPIKSLLTQQLFPAEEPEVVKEEHATVHLETTPSVCKVSTAAPGIEITSCSPASNYNKIHSSTLSSAADGSNVRRVRSESEPIPVSSICTATVVDTPSQTVTVAKNAPEKQDPKTVPSDTCDKTLFSASKVGKATDQSTTNESSCDSKKSNVASACKLEVVDKDAAKINDEPKADVTMDVKSLQNSETKVVKPQEKSGVEKSKPQDKSFSEKSKPLEKLCSEKLKSQEKSCFEKSKPQEKSNSEKSKPQEKLSSERPGSSAEKPSSKEKMVQSSNQPSTSAEETKKSTLTRKAGPAGRSSAEESKKSEEKVKTYTTTVEIKLVKAKSEKPIPESAKRDIKTDSLKRNSDKSKKSEKD